MEAKHKPMFTGSERGIDLTLDQAKKKVQKFNCNRKKDDIKAHYFSKALLRKLLEQDEAVGIRVYYGLNDKSDLDTLIVGVSKNGENIINQPVKGAKDAAGSSGYYSSASPCPRHCPSNNTDPSEN